MHHRRFMAASPVSPLTERSSLQVTVPSAQAQRVAPPRQAALSTAAQAAFVICEETSERCINRLKQWRGLATRYEKRAANYRALVVIASIVIWLDS
jgi:transposase